MQEIIDYRKKHGLTQQRLADMCGIKQPNLAKVEKGKKKISPAMALKIEAVTGIDARLLVFANRINP